VAMCVCVCVCLWGDSACGRQSAVEGFDKFSKPQLSCWLARTVRGVQSCESDEIRTRIESA
jgi:hypothetical protein